MSLRPHIYLFIFAIVIGGISAGYLADGRSASGNDDDDDTLTADEHDNPSANNDDTYGELLSLLYLLVLFVFLPFRFCFVSFASLIFQ